MTTLPTLTPCTVPDCPVPIAHRHGGDGHLLACHSTLNGRPCPHGDQDNPCYAPRETSPLHLPDVDAVARVIYEIDDIDYGTNWATQSEGVKDGYRRNVRAVLDLIAAHQPVWKCVEPGTLIKAGTHYRRGTLSGPSYEFTAVSDFLAGDGISIDPRTIPAPEDPRVAVVTDWYVKAEQVGVNDDAARELLARLDAARGESA